MVHGTHARLGPLLVRSAGLVIVLLAAPLLLLAWWKRIYPHTTLVIALAVPCLLSLALLIQPRLLPLIAIVDLAIAVVAILDLADVAAAKLVRDRAAKRRGVVSVQKSHTVTLHISNLSPRSPTGWIRDDIPQEFESQPKEFVLRLAARSRVTVHYEPETSAPRGVFAQSGQSPRPQLARPLAAAADLSASDGAARLSRHEAARGVRDARPHQPPEPDGRAADAAGRASKTISSGSAITRSTTIISTSTGGRPPGGRS